jgi:hypothetical protein
MIYREFLCVGDVVAVNPEISSGLPIQGVFRTPAPGSRPELYSTPATKGTYLASEYLNEVLTVCMKHPTQLRTLTGNVMSGEHTLNSP